MEGADLDPWRLACAESRGIFSDRGTARWTQGRNPCSPTRRSGRLEGRRPIRKIVDRFFVQMLLHGESDILSQTSFPSRLKEIRPLLGKDASGIVQNRIMLDLRMLREPYFDLISARRVQDWGDIGELANLPFYLVPAILE